MIKAIYLTGLVVAAAFTLLWLLIDDMRRECTEDHCGVQRKARRKRQSSAYTCGNRNITNRRAYVVACDNNYYRRSDNDNHGRRHISMNMTESEDQAQRNVFDWARWQKGKYPQLKAMYHAANEGKRSVRAGAELKRQGMKPGVSDICLPYASGKYNNLYVELKVGNNKASDNQLKFIDTINGIGGKAVIAYGSEAAISVITAYLEGTIDSLEIASDTYPPEKAKITERANKKRFIGFCGADCRECNNKGCQGRTIDDALSPGLLPAT